MSYTFFLGDTMLPVAPDQLQIKIKNQNKTITLINEGEVNILKRPGLIEITFRALFPNVSYPFAQYAGGFKDAAYFLEVLKRLKTQADKDGNLLPFQFIVYRAMPDGKILFDTNIKVALEEYKIVESAAGGFDCLVDISLKQYRLYGTKTVEIKPPAAAQQQATAQTAQPRPAESAPQAKTHTVASGDSLWAIAKRYLNNGERYPEIYTLNQAAIDAGNKGTGNPKYTIYPGQVFTLPA
jgi:hypothetical protein